MRTSRDRSAIVDGRPPATADRIASSTADGDCEDVLVGIGHAGNLKGYPAQGLIVAKHTPDSSSEPVRQRPGDG